MSMHRWWMVRIEYSDTYTGHHVVERKLQALDAPTASAIAAAHEGDSCKITSVTVRDITVTCEPPA